MYHIYRFYQQHSESISINLHSILNGLSKNLHKHAKLRRCGSRVHFGKIYFGPPPTPANFLVDLNNSKKNNFHSILSIFGLVIFLPLVAGIGNPLKICRQISKYADKYENLWSYIYISSMLSPCPSVLGTCQIWAKNGITYLPTFYHQLTSIIYILKV